MTTVTSSPFMFLRAETAAELMVENPVSLRADASINDAVNLFTKKGISAAPVIDTGGRPVGVLSHSDVMVHERSMLESPPVKDTMRVGELMTPAVFSVTPSTPASTVVQEMLALNVHRLFVVDAAGVLVGVISTIDILRRLQD